MNTQPRTTCYVHSFDCSQMKGETVVTYYYPELSADAQQCKRLERRIAGLQRRLTQLIAQHERLVAAVREYAEAGADIAVKLDWMKDDKPRREAALARQENNRE